MYAALFETRSWLGTLHFITTGDTASKLLSEFEKEQDLRCLVEIGRKEEKKKGQKELDKLENLLHKHYRGNLTIEDLLTLDISLSIGIIKCLCVEEGENAVAEIKAKYPDVK